MLNATKKLAGLYMSDDWFRSGLVLGASMLMPGPAIVAWATALGVDAACGTGKGIAKATTATVRGVRSLSQKHAQRKWERDLERRASIAAANRPAPPRPLTREEQAARARLAYDEAVRLADLLVDPDEKSIALAQASQQLRDTIFRLMERS